MAGSFTDLVTLLGKRAPRVAAAIAAGEAAWPAIKTTRSWVADKYEYTVKVMGTPGSTDLFDDLQEWILDLLPAEAQNALIAYSTRNRYSDPDDLHALLLGYDGTRKRTVEIGGHKVKIALTEMDRDKGRPPEICFTAASPAGRDAVLAQIREVLKKGPSRPVFRVLDQWFTGWDRASEMPPRSLKSIILPEGQLERIINDIQVFLDSEDLYLHRNLPWHRAHLYEGPPGTGKTSLAKALADHFGMDVYHLSLADVDKDTKLIRAFLDIKPRSLLLIEDIDVFASATKREDKSKKSSLSALLNALDGVATPHGLVTIMTSNHPKKLDKALLRAGRVDLREHLGLLGPKEVDRLVSLWYDKPVELGLPSKVRLAPASVTEICKRCDHPDDVVMELMAELTLSPA